MYNEGIVLFLILILKGNQDPFKS